MVQGVGEFRVGDWLAQPSLDRLSRGREQVHLRPKLMDLLCLLAQRAGEVVSGDEIIAAVWAREFISESVLTRCVAELRQALGDHASEPRFIETITKRGYRLVAPVQWGAGRPASAAGAFRWRLVWLAAGGAALLLIIVGGFLRLRTGAGTPPSGLDPGLAVVAVFENRTGAPSLDEIGRIAAGKISEGLRRTGAVRVVPSSRVSLLRRARLGAERPTGDPRAALAEATRAGIVISGVYEVEGNDLVIQAQIYDAATDSQVYEIEPATAPRDKPGEALETVQRRVMNAVAARYFNRAFDLLAWESQPPGWEAYREFLVGRELIGVDNRGVMDHLGRALALDPDFVLPLVYLTGVCFLQHEYTAAGRYLDLFAEKRDRLTPVYRRLLDSRRAMLAGRWEESVNVLRDAFQLAPTSALVAYQLGVEAIYANHPREAVSALMTPLDWTAFVGRGQEWGVWYFQNLTGALHMLGEYERELAEARRGSAIYPDTPSLRGCEVRALAALGRTEEMDRAIEESLALPSRSGAPAEVMVEAALELRAHGRREESLKVTAAAVDWLRSRGAVGTGAEAGARALAYCLLLAERWGEARALYRELATQHPDNLDYVGRLGTLAARLGDRGEAVRISDELREIDRPFLYGENTYQRACIAAQLGEKNRAMALLREAFSEGKEYGLELHRDIDLETLRGAPGFEALVEPHD